MKLTNCIAMDIGGVAIRIQAEKNDILDYLLRDFRYFITECRQNDAFDIDIEILNAPFSLPEQSTKIINTSYAFDGNIAQQIKAHGHDTWIVYKSGGPGCRRIAVYIAYEIGSSNMEKLLSGSFRTKWENCLHNFFHGPFLGLLEIELLKRGNTFLHASAYCDENGKTIALAAQGQSGKSTFVGLLTEDTARSIIAEDFCIIDRGSAVISYPKQCRVYQEQLKDTAYYKDKDGFELFLDKMNFLLFSPAKIMGLKPKRILTFEEIYYNRSFMLKAPLHVVVFLVRTGKEIKVECREKRGFVNLCVETMQNELFDNLAVFSDYLCAENTVRPAGVTRESITAEMEKLFSAMYDKTHCYVAEVPFYDTLEFVNTELSGILKKL